MDPTPFLPPAPDLPPLCACGEPLLMEFERDECSCCSCQAERALGVQKPAPGSIHPIFAGIVAPFVPPAHRRTA